MAFSRYAADFDDTVADDVTIIILAILVVIVVQALFRTVTLTVPLPLPLTLAHPLGEHCAASAEVVSHNSNRNLSDANCNWRLRG